MSLLGSVWRRLKRWDATAMAIVGAALGKDPDNPHNGERERERMVEALAPDEEEE